MIDLEKYYFKHKDDPIPAYIKNYDVSKPYSKHFFTYIRKCKGELVFITVHKDLEHGATKILFRSPSNTKQAVFTNWYPLGMGNFRIDLGNFYINKPRNFNRDELFIPECERYMRERYPYFPLHFLGTWKGYQVLEVYHKYPKIEQLMKNQEKGYFMEFLTSFKIGKKLTEDKQFRKFCGTKEFADLIVCRNIKINDFLWFYNNKIPYNTTLLKLISYNYNYYIFNYDKSISRVFKSFINSKNYQWFENYFKKMDKKRLNLWYDYYSMTNKLNKYYLPENQKIDLKEKRFVFPNNLEFWHDTRVEQLEHYMRLERLKRDLKERHEKRIESKRAKILFDNLNNLKSTERIKVLTKEKEFEHEAKVMNNCIYSMGYFEKFEKANCLICDVDNHKAVFEFDLRTKTVRQLYGYHNANLEKDYRLDVVSHINLWRDQNQEIFAKIN